MAYKSLFSVMDELFENAHPQTLHSKAEIRKVEEGHVVDILLPGFNKEEVSVKVEDKTLIIEAKTERKLPQYLNTRVKRSYLVEDIDADNIKAKLENGILSVEFSIARKKEGKEIVVE
jgi:HSP20 family protein